MPIIRSSRVLYRWLLPVVFGAVKMEIVICRLEAVVFSVLSVVRYIRLLWGSINYKYLSEITIRVWTSGL